MNGYHHELTNAFVSLELELTARNGHPMRKIRAKRKTRIQIPRILSKECFDDSLAEWMKDLDYEPAPKSKFESPPRIEFFIPQLKRRFSIPAGWVHPINTKPYPRFHVIWNDMEVRRVEQKNGTLTIRIVLIGTVHLDKEEHRTANGFTALNDCAFEAGRVAVHSF